MSSPTPLRLRARWVFPVAGPPLRDGVLTLHGERIVDVSALSPTMKNDGATFDLGDVAILPGLVNAHTHLEFSALTEPLGRPGMALPDWIRLVVSWRGSRGVSSADAVRAGLVECLRTGTTMLGEIATSPWAARAAAPRALVLREAIGLRAERQAACLAMTEEHLDQDWSKGLDRPGLSPHAPYSVHPDLLAALIAMVQRRHVPLAMHVAESREELELLREGTGPFRAMLEAFNALDETAFAPSRRSLDILQVLARAPRALVVHGNYLDDEEIAYLAERSDRMSVVYCPRTHAYFGHEPYPLAALMAGGANVALGTDSRASNPDLDLLAEARFAALQHSRIDPASVLSMATLAGARALGADDQVGSLVAGKLADLAVVRLPASDQAADPHELLFDPASRVIQTWWRGQQVYQHE